MNHNQEIVDSMASFKGKAKHRFDDALSALLVMLWPYRKNGFTWENNTELNNEVNRLLVEMDNSLSADMEDSLSELLEEEGMVNFKEDAIIWAGREIDGEDAQTRLDRHAEHLKELLAVWIALAATKSLSIADVKQQILLYGGAPHLSPLWDKPRTPVFDWGRGFQRNIVNAITVIGQDYINSGFQYAKIQKFKEDKDIIGYRTVRNSTYHCPFCDEMAQHVWPLDKVVLPYHPRCCCVATPVYDGDIII